jgi:hypothetical protein
MHYRRHKMASLHFAMSQFNPVHILTLQDLLQYYPTAYAVLSQVFRLKLKLRVRFQP